MATVARITFDDGSTEDVKIKPGDMVRAERHFKGALPQVEGTLYAAWHRLGRPGQFDSWLDTIDGVLNMGEGGDPFPEAPSDEHSQT